MHLSRRRTDMQMIRTHPQKAARRILPPTGGQNPKKAFPASARRIALQNAAANADRNRSISVPAWSPLTVTASVSQKRTVCRCQQTPVPGRHRSAEVPEMQKLLQPANRFFRVQRALSGCSAGNCFLYEKASRKRTPPFRIPCPFAGTGASAAFSLLLYPIPAVPSSAD